MPDMLTLYVVFNPNTKHIKIGITENLHRRIEQLNNSCGCRVVILGDATFGHARELEALLHKTFDSCRQSGEWFEFSQCEMAMLARLWEAYFSNFKSIGFTSFDEAVKPAGNSWVFHWRGQRSLIDPGLDIRGFCPTYKSEDS